MAGMCAIILARDVMMIVIVSDTKLARSIGFVEALLRGRDWDPTVNILINDFVISFHALLVFRNFGH
jgi:hypothetical protein